MYQEFFIHLDSRHAKVKQDTHILDSSGAFGNQSLYFVILSVQQLHGNLLWSTLLSVSIFSKAKASRANKACFCPVLLCRCCCWGCSWLPACGCMG